MENLLYEHKKWDKISHLVSPLIIELYQTNISEPLPFDLIPIIYGRHLQIVINYSKMKTSKYSAYGGLKRSSHRARRYDISEYITRKSHQEILNEARKISKKIIDKIESKYHFKQSNITKLMLTEKINLYKLDFKFTPEILETFFPFKNSGDYLLYVGRCIQFLIDTNRKKYTYENLGTLIYEEIINKAHKIKTKILIEQRAPYRVNCHCTCDDHNLCTWTPWNNRCDCDNAKFWFIMDLKSATLDDVIPSGSVEDM